MKSAKHTQLSPSLVPILAAIFACTPLAIDMYLPAMTMMADSFATDISLVQLSLSIYLAGYGIGMLFFGPIGDRVGKRSMVIFGLLSIAITSILLALAPDINSFLVLRFLQAFLGSAATVVIPGYIREIYGKDTAKGMSYLSMIMMLAPMIAPSFGSLILNYFGWPAIFMAIALYAFIALAVIFNKLPQGRAPEGKGRISAMESYAIVFKERSIYPYLACLVFSSFALFLYITGIPYVYMGYFQADNVLFSTLMAVAVVGIVLANFINAKLVGKLGALTMLKYSGGLAVILSFLMVIFTAQDFGIYWIVACIIPIMGCAIIIGNNSFSLILMSFEAQASTASAVVGTLRFGSGALAGPVLAIFFNQSPMPFVMLMFVSLSLSLLSVISLQKALQKEPINDDMDTPEQASA